jgi:hypothetical protein
VACNVPNYVLKKTPRQPIFRGLASLVAVEVNFWVLVEAPEYSGVMLVPRQTLHFRMCPVRRRPLALKTCFRGQAVDKCDLGQCFADPIPLGEGVPHVSG